MYVLCRESCIVPLKFTPDRIGVLLCGQTCEAIAFVEQVALFCIPPMTILSILCLHISAYHPYLILVPSYSGYSNSSACKLLPDKFPQPLLYVAPAHRLLADQDHMLLTNVPGT